MLYTIQHISPMDNIMCTGTQVCENYINEFIVLVGAWSEAGENILIIHREMHVGVRNLCKYRYMKTVYRYNKRMLLV